MTDYVPIHSPGHQITLTASAAITGGQVLIATGNNTVGPAGAAATAVVGVAAHDAANGAKLTVLTGVGQVHHTEAAAAVTAGDLLATGAAGTVAPIGAGTFGQAVGVALSGAALGAECTWKAIR